MKLPFLPDSGLVSQATVRVNFHGRRDPGFVTGFAHQETNGLRRLFVLAQSGRKQLNLSEHQHTRNEEHEGRTEEIFVFFVFFVSSWLSFIVCGRRHGRHERLF
ncbi:MAG: hypothetical protein ACREBD_36225 [Blastocatellia bacterium]